MPNRIVRDAVLDSPRYHELSSDTIRLLFFELLLLADDYGLTPAYPLFLSRRTSAARRATDEAISKMTGELCDHDLIRLYPVGAQVYAFIPRFGNWPRAKKPKWPMPPDALGGTEIKNLQEKRSAKSAQMQCDDGANAHETETETETETEEKKRSSSAGADRAAFPNCPHALIVQSYHDALPELQRVKLMDGKARKTKTAEFWKWVLSSAKTDGTKRATNTEEALAWIASYYKRAGTNDFLMGRGGERTGPHKDWRADFDFLLTEKGRKHVIEKTEVPA